MSMSEQLEFAWALLLNGISIGLMYSLIALGFVLVYKATDAINFAQGEFVMFAGFIAAAMLAVEGVPLIVAALALNAFVAFGLSAAMIELLKAEGLSPTQAVRPTRPRWAPGHSPPP